MKSNGFTCSSSPVSETELEHTDNINQNISNLKAICSEWRILIDIIFQCYLWLLVPESGWITLVWLWFQVAGIMHYDFAFQKKNLSVLFQLFSKITFILICFNK